MDFRKFARRILILLTLTNSYSLCAGNRTEYKTIDIVLEDAKHFPGNWSLVPEEIYLALKHCRYQKKIKILEFGAGESTIQLAKLLAEKKIPFEYHVFENDPSFVRDIKDVTYHLYDLPTVPFHRSREWKGPVAEYKLPELPAFDLVIVDGPHGVARAEWYSKFKKYTKTGTVILIDDFHHYKEFGEALDANFKYTTIIEYNQSPDWKIINDGLEPISGRPVGKTFKIVEITSIKTLEKGR